MSWLSEVLGLMSRGRHLTEFHDTVKAVADEGTRQLAMPEADRDPSFPLAAVTRIAKASHDVLG